MVEEGIRGRICHSIYRYAKAKSKYMKDYDKNKESSYIQYGDVNLYDWTIQQKLSVNNFEWIDDTSQFNEYFIKSYNEESDKDYFLEVAVQYIQTLHELQIDLQFLPERIKIEKIEKLVTNLHETEYVIHISNLKQTLNHGLVSKKFIK